MTVLAKMAELLLENEELILTANRKDVENFRTKNNNKAMIDRLMLTPKRIKEMADSLYTLISLPDPIGEVLSMWKRPNGLTIGQKRVPIGVIGSSMKHVRT